jgi:hypothetical protein
MYGTRLTARVQVSILAAALPLAKTKGVGNLHPPPRVTAHLRVRIPCGSDVPNVLGQVHRERISPAQRSELALSSRLFIKSL